MDEREIELAIATDSKRIDALEDRIGKLEEKWDAIYKMASSIELLAQRLGYVERNVSGIDKKLDNLYNTFNETDKRVTNRIIDAEYRPYKETHDAYSGIKVSLVTSALSFVICGILGAIMLFGK